jgi:hypothetical protein
MEIRIITVEISQSGALRNDIAGKNSQQGRSDYIDLADLANQRGSVSISYRPQPSGHQGK